jgi:hypothetical protein
MRSPVGHIALGAAFLAVALSIYAINRVGPGRYVEHVCVDEEARREVAALRQTVAQRDAVIASLGRRIDGASGSGSGSAGAATVPGAPTDPANPGPPVVEQADARRFVRFEVPNPAVTVTQKDDGTLEVRTTDPSLAGSVLTVTAITANGHQERVLVRVP